MTTLAQGAIAIPEDLREMYEKCDGFRVNHPFQVSIRGLIERCARTEAQLRAAEERVAVLSAAVSDEEMDEVCCEYGAPEYVKTDDGEAWYWRFQYAELPVADHLSDLLRTGIEMMLAARAKADAQPPAELLDKETP